MQLAFDCAFSAATPLPFKPAQHRREPRSVWHGTGPRYAQLAVRGGQRRFAAGEQFFVQFFAWTQTGKLDAHLLFGETRQTDHLAREVDDFDRITHVENEDLAARTHQPGLQHQLRRLRDRHEIAHDIRVGHRDRAAARDLLAEFRNDAASGAEHIAEAHHDEPRPGRRIERLAHQLGQPFRCAHYIGWIDRLVGRNQDEPGCARIDRGTTGDIGAKRVVGQRLPSVFVFHQRHVFVGGSVKYRHRPVQCHQRRDARAVAHVGNRAHQRQGGRETLQFLTHGVQRQFAALDQHQLLRLEACDLPHQFGSNRATGTGNHHGVAGQQCGQTGVVEHHRVAPEQVVEFHFANRRYLHLAAHQVVKRWHRQGMQAGLAAGLDDAPPLTRARFRAGNDGVAGRVPLRRCRQPRQRAGYTHLLYHAPGHQRIVVNQSDHAPIGRTRQFLEQIDCSVTGANHQHWRALGLQGPEQAVLLPGAVSKTAAAHDEHQQQGFEHKYRTRHAGDVAAHQQHERPGQAAGDDREHDAPQVGQ